MDENRKNPRTRKRSRWHIRAVHGISTKGIDPGKLEELDAMLHFSWAHEMECQYVEDGSSPCDCKQTPDAKP